MVKSTMHKKGDFEQAQELFATVGTKYIKEWTDKQLRNYIDQPVVIPIGNYGFLIGSFHVRKINTDCWRVQQQDGKHLHDFVTKSNAVLYCLKLVRNSPNADNLLELDRQIGKLDKDIEFYEHTIKNTNNKFKIEVALNRCANARMQRKSIYNILKKTLNSAKYLKFGNTPL